MKYLLTLFLLSASAIAADINYFGSIYFQDDKNQFGDNFGEKMDYTGLSKLGANVYSPITEKVKFHGQVLTEGIAQTDDWGVFVDYSFLKFTLDRNFELYAGRQIFPVWLASEYSDVGYETPFIKLPTSVDGLSPFKSLNGLSVRVALSESLHIKPFVGQENGKLNITSTGGEISIKYQDIYGMQVKWEPTIDIKLQANYYQSDVDISSNSANLLQAEELNTDKVRVFSSGISYDPGDYYFAAEYGKKLAKLASGAQSRTEATYTLIGYHYQKIFARYIFQWTKASRSTIKKISTHIIGTNINIDDGYVIKADVETSKIDIGTDKVSYKYVIGVDFVF